MGMSLALGRAVLHGATPNGHEGLRAGVVRRVTGERALGIVLRAHAEARLRRGAVRRRVTLLNFGAALLLRAGVAGRFVVDLWVHTAIGGGGVFRGITAR